MFEFDGVQRRNSMRLRGDLIFLSYNSVVRYLNEKNNRECHLVPSLLCSLIQNHCSCTKFWKEIMFLSSMKKYFMLINFIVIASYFTRAADVDPCQSYASSDTDSYWSDTSLLSLLLIFLHVLIVDCLFPTGLLLVAAMSVAQLMVAVTVYHPYSVLVVMHLGLLTE